MLRLLTILMVSLLLTTVGCTSSSDVPQVGPNAAETPDLEDDASAPEDIMSGVGTITYVDLEGGFYGIETDDGERLNPQDLGEEFQRDGLRVRFRVEKADMMTIQMWGTPVRVLEMLQVAADQ